MLVQNANLLLIVPARGTVCVCMMKTDTPDCIVLFSCTEDIASSPGHSQILSRSRGEKSGEGLVPLLRHGSEMVDSVST